MAKRNAHLVLDGIYVNGLLRCATCTGGGDEANDCLLYTSDAADERSSVDLGGRRIIKKKKHKRPRSTMMRRHAQKRVRRSKPKTK